MRKESYDEATRIAFTQAALAARNEAKPWSEAFAAAESAGYRGTLAGIKQFLFKATHKAPVSETASAETPAVEAASQPKKKAKKAVAKSGSKKQRILYDEATTQAILTAVSAARATGDWNAAHVAAQGAGYKGGLSGLMQFVSNKGGAKKPKKTAAKATKAARKKVVKAAVPAPAAHSATGFALGSIPEAIRGDFAGWVRAKIEKEFKHSIKDKNVDQATAVYLEIAEAQNALNAKIEALKSL